jgi:hypothetical protein
MRAALLPALLAAAAGCPHDFTLRDSAAAAEAAVDGPARDRPADARVGDSPRTDWSQPDAAPCPSPCVSTFAGQCGTMGRRDGPAAQALFHVPEGLALDGAGALYVADYGNCTIRRIAGGQVSTFAGTGKLAKIDGPAGSAAFAAPTGLAFLAPGQLAVADLNSVRLIADGQVTTLAGGVSGYQDGPAASARFGSASALVLTATGLLVVDATNSRLRQIAQGQVSTVAGSGIFGFADGSALQAAFDTPCDAVQDASGVVYIVDNGNLRIRAFSGGQVTTLAGSGGAGLDDGPAASATFGDPQGAAVDSSGAVLVSDAPTYGNRIRRIANGQVSTLAGTDVKGYLDGPALTARFNSPSRMVVDASGAVYVADTGNNCIRLIR